MTSALIPLAASSLIALSGGAPSGGHARQSEHAEQQEGQRQPHLAGQGPTRMSGRPSANIGVRPGQPRSQHARTAPDDAHSSSSQHSNPDGGQAGQNNGGQAHSSQNNGGQNNGGQAHSSQSNGGQRNPPPRSANAGHQPANAHATAQRNPPPRGASSHAAPAHGARPAPRPAPHYTPWDPTPHRVYVQRHQHVAPWHPAYWTAGVFVYAAPPPPAPGVARPAQSARATAPARDLDRSESFSIGLRSGSFMSGYEGGASYGDFGVGVTARYRANEAIGLEASYGYFSDDFTSDTERVSQPMSASVELFAFPWTRVSPYVLGGVSWTARSYNDTFTTISGEETYETRTLEFGPHGGLGLELAVGENASINFEGKYTHYVSTQDDDSSLDNNLQGLVGVNLYF